MGDDFGASLLTRAFSAIPAICSSNGSGADVVATGARPSATKPRPPAAINTSAATNPNMNCRISNFTFLWTKRVRYMICNRAAKSSETTALGTQYRSMDKPHLVGTDTQEVVSVNVTQRT